VAQVSYKQQQSQLIQRLVSRHGTEIADFQLTDKNQACKVTEILFLRKKLLWQFHNEG